MCFDTGFSGFYIAEIWAIVGRGTPQGEGLNADPFFVI